MLAIVLGVSYLPLAFWVLHEVKTPLPDESRVYDKNTH